MRTKGLAANSCNRTVTTKVLPAQALVSPAGSGPLRLHSTLDTHLLQHSKMEMIDQNDGFKILNMQVVTRKKHPLVSHKMTKPFWEFNFFVKEYDDFLPDK